MIAEVNSCDCSHCQLGLGIERRIEILSNFLTAVFVLLIKNNRGFKLETLDSEIQQVAEIFSKAIFTDETPELKDEMEFAYNKAFSFFDTPFNYYHAFAYFEEESTTAIKAVEDDSDIRAAPILTGIITPNILQEFIYSGELPESVNKIINQSKTLLDVDKRFLN